MPPKKALASGKVNVKQSGQKQMTKTPSKLQAKNLAKKGSTETVTAKGVTTPANKLKKEVEKPQKKEWTQKDEAARTIQNQIRSHLARNQLNKRRQEKLEYESLMEKLEQEAFVKLVKMEQEQAEKQRQKEEEERRRKREEAKRKKRMLEAAFDGDVDEINQILKEAKEQDDKDGIGHDIVGQAIRNKHQLNLVECEDANANTPFSEASSGGCVEVIKTLIAKGANPNSKGQFGRTPLYRAAFAGHLEAVQCLLQYGADPRIYAEDGQTPVQIASHASIVETLTSWDVSQTEILLEKIKADAEKRKEEERKRKEVETGRIEDQIAEAETEYKSKQKHLRKCTEELNKRIFEHDQAMTEGFNRPEILIQAIHDAEVDLEISKLDVEKARDKLSALKLLLRDKQMEGLSESEAEDLLPGLKIAIRDLEDVLLRDVGNRIKDSGKWPLIIDTTGQVSTFLTYRDTNYLNALNPNKMTPDIIRMAILGALRYGKPLVLDMMEVDMFQTVTDRFNEIATNLMSSILDKTIIEEKKYAQLLKQNDPPAYDKLQFMEQRLSNFKFFVITKNPFPEDILMDKMYVIRIHTST